MKPPLFDYRRARSTADALRLLADADGAKVLAGGQSLLPMLNFRLASVDQVVDIDGLTELDRVLPDGDAVLLGALVRHARLVEDEAITASVPLLADAARHIGHVGIRNRGTLGGSLAHADPTAELPATMLALNATMICESAGRGPREIPAEEFFVSLYATALEPDELLTWVRVPLPAPGSGWGFAEVAPREGDFAWAGAVCTMLSDDHGGVTDVRAVVFGVEPTPALVHAGPVDNLDIDGLAAAWTAPLRPTSDEAYQRDLAQAMLARAVASAAARLGVTGG